MKGYKAFKKGLVCSPNGNTKQYAENTVFEEEDIDICHSGMHFCQNPMDCLDYYDLVDGNGELTEICNVEAIGDIDTDDNRKFCTNKLKIGAKIDIMGFVKSSINYIRENVSSENAGGDRARLVGGNDAKLVGGKNSVMVGGNGSIAKGLLGSVIVLTDSDKYGNITSYKAEQVDGVRIKENIFYRLENGEFKEVENE